MPQLCGRITNGLTQLYPFPLLLPRRTLISSKRLPSFFKTWPHRGFLASTNRSCLGQLWASQLAQWWRIHQPMQETQETWVWSLGQEDSLEEEMATHSSTLAWRNSWTEEPGGLPSMGSHRIGHNWSDLAAAAAHGTEFNYCPSLDLSADNLSDQRHIPGIQDNGVGCLLKTQLRSQSSTLTA